MAFGNPMAFEIGGGPSAQEQIYAAIKSAVGEGNSADGGVYDTIAEAWRFAKSRGLAIYLADDRAIAQHTPVTASDKLATFERLLGVHFSKGVTQEARRAALIEKYTYEIDDTTAGLLAALQKINPAVEIQRLGRELGRESQFGRAFEDYDPNSFKASGPAFAMHHAPAGDKCTLFANYSSDFVLLVQSPIVLASFGEHDKHILEQLKNLLNENLPAWVDFRLYVNCGFILDQDLLDATVFCDGFSFP